MTENKAALILETRRDVRLLATICGVLFAAVAVAGAIAGALSFVGFTAASYWVIFNGIMSFVCLLDALFSGFIIDMIESGRPLHPVLVSTPGSRREFNFKLMASMGFAGLVTPLFSEVMAVALQIQELLG